MVTDYRNTKYCPTLDNIENDKEILYKTISQKHQNAEDMHPLVADKEKYKKSFAAIYNNKCAYCGVSLRLLPLNSFEIDHVRCKSSFTNSSEAGHIDNLVFSCQSCNRHKSSYLIPDNYSSVLHPDRALGTCFYRDELYNIRISPERIDDNTVKSFYDKLCFFDEVHRLDYLLMNMIGLSRRLVDKPEVKLALTDAIEILRTKRNIVR